MAFDPQGAPHADKLTYDDYLSMPDDGKRYEILDGELAVTASPLTVHQRVSRDLGYILHAHVKAQGLGEILDAPVDVILNDSTIVVPDLVFVSRERSAIVTKRAIEGPPDLIVEILSASTGPRDRGAKSKLYARFGVPWYWIVDPEARTLEVLKRRQGRFRTIGEHAAGDVFSSPLFPGLEIPLVEVWS